MLSVRLWLFVVLLPTLSALAQTQAQAQIKTSELPSALQEWQEWVLFEHRQIHCPRLYHRLEQHRCAWPSVLHLDIRDNGGSFAQSWTVDADSWLRIPGDRSHWPQEVKLNGQPVVVLEHDGHPVIKAVAGEHLISGRLIWQQIPQTLSIPADTALLEVSRDSQPVVLPTLETDGTLWLQKRSEQVRSEDHLTLEVFRHLRDDIPLVLTTRLDLSVSGRAREVLLGPIIGSEFTPLSLDSELPARIENNGQLRLQLKPGRWTITVRARHNGPESLSSIQRPSAAEPWPAQEIWVVQTMNALRMVQISGASSLDPNQTNLPDAWRQLPAYLMPAEQTLQLVERKRGDAEPAPDRLQLQRSLWLDFDGDAYSVQDQISGTLSASTRLQALPPLQLGRVAVNGQDQFITRLNDNAHEGVEIRQRDLQLVADSRLQPDDIQDLPAVGWDFSVLSNRTTLNLPPGWRLLAASGADSVSNTWFYRWTLLDIFIVLITAISFARLWGWLHGLLALLGLLLIYHEADAPRLIWLNALAAIALLHLVPQGRLQTLLRWYRNASLLVLLVVAFVFSVQQVRQALYPQLARLHYSPLQQVSDFAVGGFAQAPPELAVDVAAPAPAPRTSKLKVTEEESPAAATGRSFTQQMQYASDIKVQTGPGLPSWRWQQSVLSWNGPVTQQQRLQLYLLSPWATRIWLLAGVVLLTLMFIRLLRPLRWRFQWAKTTTASLSLLTLSLCLFNTSALAQTQPQTQPTQQMLPSVELLDELRQRLTALPDCQPSCAALSHLHIVLATDELEMTLELHSQIDTAAPLPFPLQRLQLRQLTFNEDASLPLYRDHDHLLWARLTAGKHRLNLKATIPGGLASLQLPLPMRPGRVTMDLNGWQASGVFDEVAEGQIQFDRLRPAQNDNTKELQPGTMPAFVRVERELILAIDWQLHTRITRLSQADSAAVLSIPLLPGEQVTSPGVRVQDRQVLVNLPAQQSQLSWDSNVNKSELIELQASTDPAVIELWRLRAHPIWHIESEGIPLIYRFDDSGEWLPQWQPWPGEQLNLSVSRPQGVDGKTVTIDYARLDISPGERATESKLQLNFRSSRGVDHTLTLPENAELTGVTINGVTQPIKADNAELTLPLTPGKQSAELTWRQSDGIHAQFQTPAFQLGSDSVNNHIVVELPRNRWTLFTRGPILGPAVLFWGILIVIAVAAFALARYGKTPLGVVSWFLLGVGLSQTHVLAALPVIVWLLLLGRRKALGEQLSDSRWQFNLLQLFLAGLSLVALVTMLGAIEQGLLGHPQMQIAGNGSSAYELQWYQDRSNEWFPQAQIISVPLLVYRLLMLAWALWLALALLKWLAWGWQCFSSDGLWRKITLKKAK